MKRFTPGDQVPAVSTKITPDRSLSTLAVRTLAVCTADRSSRTLAVRTNVHAGGTPCGYQCLAYRKCLGDDDDSAAIRCDM